MIIQFIIVLNNLNLVFAIQESSKSIDQLMGEKYKFDLFENFEACAEVYQHEKKVVDKLMEIKSKLSHMAKHISTFNTKSKYNINKDMILKLRKNLIGEGQLKKIKSSLNSLSHILPRKKDYKGAIKAMFMLHYSYDLNLTHAITEGGLLFINQERVQVEFNASIFTLLWKAAHIVTKASNI